MAERIQTLGQRLQGQKDLSSLSSAERRNYAAKANIFWGQGNHHSTLLEDHDTRNLIPSASPEIRRTIEIGYMPRIGAVAFPDSDRRVNFGVILEIPTQQAEKDVRGQLSYLNEMRASSVPELRVYTPEDVRRLEGDKLVVPYLMPPREEAFIQELGAEAYGPPGELFQLINDKANFHSLASEYSREHPDEPYDVPQYENVKTEEISAKGPKFMEDIERTYDELGFYDKYHTKGAIGVVLRGADSDGGFGVNKIRKIGDGWKVDSHPDIKFTNIEDAFRAAQEFFFENMDQKVCDDIVMSRFMDVAESPGESIVVQNGEVFSLGWNGQMQWGEDSSCVGTTNYQPEPNSHAEKLYKELKDQTADQFGKFIKWVAEEKAGIDFNSLRMIVNQDMMIPTELEAAFQRKAYGRVKLDRAESNFRLSSRTRAVVGASLLGEAQQTPQGLIRTSELTTEYLNYPGIPTGLDRRIVREALGEAFKGRSIVEGTALVCVATTPQENDPQDETQKLGLVVFGAHDAVVKNVNRVIAKLTT